LINRKILISEMATINKYDLVVVGSGFASMFYLHGILKSRVPPKRILVLERGARLSHGQYLKRQVAAYPESETKQAGSSGDRFFINRTPGKPWNARIAFGGGSNCWFGSTPRMLPDDFKMKSRFGVGQDWPIDYSDLEPFYCEVEEVMQISGGVDTPYPMSRPYPLGPHRFSEVDLRLKEAYPDRFFAVPTARSSRPGKRPACCNNGVCFMCPIDAKFTIENGMAADYQHSRVDIVFETEVVRLEHHSDYVTGVVCKNQNSTEFVVGADRVALGANGIVNPFILLRSGIEHPQTGLGLCEQAGVKAMIRLEGMKNFQGSTITTGFGVNDLIGSHRNERAGFMFNTVNRAMNLSLTRGEEFSTLEVVASVEDFRQSGNRVIYDRSSDKPHVIFNGVSDLTARTINEMPSHLERILSVLPLKEIRVIPDARTTESHIQCTTPMGDHPETSVVDRHGFHHRKRNLVILGSGLFPTASPPNPTLTLSALSLLFASHHS
jgi:choline dehydrogenase-like flavoprotein